MNITVSVHALTIHKSYYHTEVCTELSNDTPATQMVEGDMLSMVILCPTYQTAKINFMHTPKL